MSMLVQRNLAECYSGCKVAYKDNSVSGEQLMPGYCLVMDPTEDLEPASDEWGEEVLGRTFVKADGNNRNQRTVVVVETPQILKHGSVSDFSNVDVKVIDTKAAMTFYALVAPASYTTGSLLQIADGEFYLETQSAGPTAQTVNTFSVARVIKTLNLSGESGPVLMKVAGI